MFKQIIGEKRAREIVSQMIEAASEANIALPKCRIYLEKVSVHDLMEAYAEIREYANREGGFRFPYDDSLRLTDYVRTIALTKEQIALIEKPNGVINVHNMYDLVRFSKEFFK